MEKENSVLKEALSKSTADLKVAKSDQKTSQRKINFTQKVTEQKLLDSISREDGFHADPTLIGVYSATLDEDEFDFDDDTGDAKDNRSRKDAFLLSIEEKLNPADKEQKVRFAEIKNRILENVKASKSSRDRSRSGSVSGRGSSSKRELSADSLKSSPASRPRTMLPVKK